MSSRDLESAESGTISPSQDDAFEKFLDEPLSTSSSSSKNSRSAKPTTAKVATERMKQEFDRTPHTWLKTALGTSTAGPSEKSRDEVQTQISKDRKSSRDIESEMPVKQVSLEIPYLGSPQNSSDDEESSSFQINLQKAIDLSILGTSPDDDYTDTFEGEGQREKTSAESLTSNSQNDNLVSEIADEPDLTLQSSKTSSLQESIINDDVAKSVISDEDLGRPAQAIESSEIHVAGKMDESDAALTFEAESTSGSEDQNDVATKHDSSALNEEHEPIFLHIESRQSLEATFSKELSLEEIARDRVLGENTTQTEVPSQLEMKETKARPEFTPRPRTAQPSTSTTIRSATSLSSASPRQRSPASKDPQSARNRPLVITRGSPVASRGTAPTRNATRGRPPTRARGGTQPLSGSEVTRLKQQLVEQEHLLKGFQAENENLYEDMRVRVREVQDVKASAAKELEQFNWQLGNLKEKIRFLEFGKQTSFNKMSDVCENCQSLLQIQKENEELKKEMDALKSSVLSASSQQHTLESSIQVPQDAEVGMLRDQLIRVEQLAADLQLRLTKSQQTEQNLKARLECFSRKQTSSQTVAFLEEQLRKLFQIQETRDGTLKELLDDIYQQQNIMKQAYHEAIRQAEETFQEQRLELEFKLKEAESQRGVPTRLIHYRLMSTSIQCDLLTENNMKSHPIEPKPMKLEKLSKSIQCNIGNMRKMQRGQFSRRAKSVQCYLGDDISSHVALENKELKLKMERLILEHEDSKQYVQNLLRERDKWKSKPNKKTDIRLNQLSTESQLQAALESQQVLLEHVQSRLETVQGEWEQMLRENASLKHQLHQQTFQSHKYSGNQPNARSISLLERQIAELEKRHEQREQELSGLQLRASLGTSDQLSQELARCQDQLHQKNSVINHYRQELDTIIAFLRQLLRDQQGMPHHW